MLTERAIPIDLDGENGDMKPFAVLDDLADRAREKSAFRLLCIR